MPSAERQRELTWEERIRWGECPICHAPDGEPCHAGVGVQVGQRADGQPLNDGDGVHIGRINRAPTRVKEVPA